MAIQNKEAEPIKEYYIAYFDLLGYKEFFRRYPENVGDFLQDIHNAISGTKDYIQGINESFVGSKIGKLEIKTKLFSDNILLCIEKENGQIDYPRFIAFLTIVADIQRNFILKHGLFLRGGITIGTLSFNEDYVFGQGLIDVVALESDATYPRIVIGEKAKQYIFQPHFVRQDDLDRACDIEKRAHEGENITDEELAFCNLIKPAVDIERFYLQWRDYLLWQAFDGTISLNYLYYPDIKNMVGPSTMNYLLELLKGLAPSDYQKLTNSNPDQKQWLERHKYCITQKIKEFGNYEDIEATEAGAKDAEKREYILKKYLWVLMFHNHMCLRYQIPECRIQSGSTCDVRFIRLTVEIFDGNTSQAKQQ